MSRGLRTQLLIALALLLAAGGIAQAQAFGRVTVNVKDQDGKAIEGVKVTVTCSEAPSFHEEEVTNQKGRATFGFADATMVYSFRFEYQGYPPMDMPIKPEIKGSIKRNVTLVKGQPPPAAGGGGRIYSPAERVFNEGVQILQSGDLALAKIKFQEALVKNEKMALAHSALAGVYLEEGDHAAALGAAQRFLELEPDNPRGVRLLYEAHRGLGNQGEAEAALKKLKGLDQGGDTVAMIYNEGVDAVKVGDYAGAKKRFAEALEIDPDLTPAIGAMAIIHANESSWADAAAMAERHLALKPGDTKLLRIRWDAYRQLGEAEKAQAAFQELAAADPKVLAMDLFKNGNELFEGGDVAGAKALFEKVLEIDPGHARGHYRLGICHASAEEYSAARKHLEKFIELAPDDPEAPVARDMLGFLK